MVQGDCLHIDSRVVAFSVEFLTPGDGLKDIRLGISFHPGLMDAQHQFL
jgi:hypothetical protein